MSIRVLLLKEDYCGTLAVMTDCKDSELYHIIKVILRNDENGVGETLTEIVEREYPNRTMIELVDSEQEPSINELDYEYIVSRDYLGFCKIVN